jgi:hypothetical protein
MHTEVVARVLAHGDGRLFGSARSLWFRMRSWSARLGCAVHGHDLLIRTDRGRRLYLRCETCGYESPGWMLK